MKFQKEESKQISKRLLAGKDIESLGDADLDASFRNLSGKLGLLTEAIQKADNQALVKEEENC